MKKLLKPETYGNFIIKVVKVPVDVGYEVVAMVFRAGKGTGKALLQATGKTKDEAVKRVKKTINKNYL
jgi:hypothetical protein